MVSAFSLISCAPDAQTISIIETTQSEVQTVAEENKAKDLPPKFGFAIWGDEECTVWIVNRREFRSESEFNQTLGHEVRHCFEGAYHPE